MASKRDIPSSSRGAVPIPTLFEMSQYVEEVLTSVVPGIWHRTDWVLDFLWYPNTEHHILEAATGGLDAVTTCHNKMWLKYQTAYAGTLRAMGLYQLFQMAEENADKGLCSGLYER
ncbi:uncharacterized protein LOC144568512 isoform X2 [Carex rostrata]